MPHEKKLGLSEAERTSSLQSTFSLRQISLRRNSVLLTSSGLKRNFEQREVMGSMMLGFPRIVRRVCENKEEKVVDRVT